MSGSYFALNSKISNLQAEIIAINGTLTTNVMTLTTAQTAIGAKTFSALVTATGGLTTGGASVLTSSGTTSLVGATTATGLITANGGLTTTTLTATGISKLKGTLTSGTATTNSYGQVYIYYDIEMLTTDISVCANAKTTAAT